MDEDTKLVIDVPGALLLDEEMVTQAIEEVGIKAEVVEDELTRVIGDELTQVTGGGLKEVIGEEFESELVVDEDWTEVTHEVDTQVIEEVPLDADSLVEADTGRGHMVLELTAGGQDEDSEGVSLVPVNTEDAEDVTYATLHPDYEEVNEDSADAECQIRIRDFREFCDAEVEVSPPREFSYEQMNYYVFEFSFLVCRIWRTVEKVSRRLERRMRLKIFRSHATFALRSSKRSCF